MAIDRSKFLARFTDEAREHCTKLTDGLLLLERKIEQSSLNSDDDSSSSDNIQTTYAAPDAETINALFRSAHTIKGSARMMKLTSIGELAHGMEDLLDSVRNGKTALNSQSFELLFKSADVLLSMIDSVTSPDGPPPAPADLCEALKEAAAEISKSLEEPVQNDSTKSETLSTKSETLSKSDLQPNTKIPQAETPHKTQYLRVNRNKLDDLIRLMGDIISHHNHFKNNVKTLQENIKSAISSINNINLLIEKNHTADSEEIKSAAKNSMAVKINLQKAARTIADAVLMQSHFMGELQDTTLKFSMMPLSTVFDPLRLTVRDLAKDSGKDVVFDVSGGETELDRKIAERIGDSLLHMIRNSLDHGIENPKERTASGKPHKGTIILSAFYDNGGVTITLKDDGQGLNLEKIKQKALSKKLFNQETLEMMSKSEILNLIFLPGFSTSSIITDLSGRGVGMDVVHKNIVDELKGSIMMNSSKGEGTTFILRLPLNLAVFPLCMISASNQIFAFPAASIAELCSIKIEDIIEIIGKKAIRLRNEIIPVEYLASILKLEFKEKDADASISVVVVKDGADKLGLMVDKIIEREEMVVKPLPTHLSNLKIVTGAAIGIGDSIINVLHVPEIMKLASRAALSISMSGKLKIGDKLKIEECGLDDSIGHNTLQSAVILVVDDSMNTREIEKGILEAYGYTVETAEDGQDALEKAGCKVYDLVITDVEMPRLDGFSLTEKLRTDSRYSTVPIIIVTSLEKESDKKRGIKAGADAYIVKKAFDQSNLLDTVRNLIG